MPKTETKKPTTHVLMLVDDSGSMHGLAEDTRGGFNSYVGTLCDDADVRYRVTAATFSAPRSYRVLCAAAAPQEVPALDAENYRAMGDSTALFDAVGKLIADFEQAVPELGAGDRVLLVVQTDGQNNSSREYTARQVADLIAKREAGKAWTAIFMGAGPDTWQQGPGMGFNHSVAVANTSVGTLRSYSGLATATAGYARGATGQQVADHVAAAQDEE